MPEGDTVHLSARRLDDALAGKVLTRTDFRVPQHAIADLSGKVMSGVIARGKHILMRIDDVTLHTHFKMEGEWHLYRHGERFRGPGHQVRVVLETDDWVAVGFRLGIIELVPASREDEIVGHLGPDLLGPDWDAEIALKNLTADGERPISDVLLDQRVMAGLGNVYKSELCFLSGLDPWTSVAAISDPAALIDRAKRVMEANRNTGMQITTGENRPGRRQWVYGRGGEPCRRCGTPISRRADPGDRVTYWCPTCQPPNFAN
ncbi:MAG: DNA-formamidopyrimidine glycosylase family protein [Actinomycetota bacterium]